MRVSVSYCAVTSFALLDAIAAMGSRVPNDLGTVDRPLPDRLLLLVRSALLDPKNDIIY